MTHRSEFPGLRCQNPQHITHPYSREDILVPCHKCASCRATRAISSSSKISVEFQSAYESNCCVCFVTLTFSNDFVPRVRVVSSHTDVFDGYIMLSDCERDERYQLGETVGYLSNDVYHLDDVITLDNITSTRLEHLHRKSKTLGTDYFFYPLRDDVVKFLKRLGKQLFLKFNSYGLFRYYLVSEFGPQTLRPHYHLLLFATSPRVLFDDFRCAVDKAWTYGHVLCEKAVSDNGDYLSSYCCSNISLPSLFQHDFFKTFSSHSQFFGYFPTASDVSTVYDSQTLPTDACEHPFSLGGEQSTLYDSSALCRALLPVIPSFDFLDDVSRRHVYLSYHLLSRSFGTTCCTTIAKLLYDFCICLRMERPFGDLQYIDQFTANCLDVLQKLFWRRRLSPLERRHPVDYKYFLPFLYKSKYFITNILQCKIELFHERYNRLCSLLDCIALRRLRDFYNLQLHYCNYEHLPLEFINGMYYNHIPSYLRITNGKNSSLPTDLPYSCDLYDSELYLNFIDNDNAYVSNMVKHKRLYDSLNIFNYQPLN